MEWRAGGVCVERGQAHWRTGVEPLLCGGGLKLVLGGVSLGGPAGLRWNSVKPRMVFYAHPLASCLGAARGSAVEGGGEVCATCSVEQKPLLLKRSRWQRLQRCMWQVTV